MLGFKRRFSLLVLLSSLGYLLSFCNQLVISYFFGTDITLDAYWAALGIANFLCFYLHPLKEALVPATFRRSKISTDQASLILSSGLSLLALLAGISAIILYFFPNILIALLGKTSHSGNQLLKLLPWFIPFLFLFTFAETLSSIMLGFNKNVTQASSRLIASIASLTVLWVFSRKLGITAMVGSLLVNQLVVVLISLWSLKEFKITLKWHPFSILKQESVFSLFGSLFVSYLIAQFYVLLERSVMMKLAPGLLSSYQYSTTLVNTLLSMIAFPFANLLWHQFLEADHHKNMLKAQDMLYRALGAMFIALLPICLFIFLNSKSIIFIIYSRGAFDAASLETTSEALRATIFAAIPIGLTAITGRYIISSLPPQNSALVGIAMSLGSISVIMCSSYLMSAHLVQWNWIFGNTLGLIASLILTVKHLSVRLKEILNALGFIFKFIILVIITAWIAPNFAEQNFTKIQTIGHLALNLITYSTIFVSLAVISGLTKRIKNLLTPYAT